MTVAKGMNSGYAAVGATVVSRRLAEYFHDRPIAFGFTSGGQPLGFAACIAVVETIRAEGLVENARRMGELLRVELGRIKERHPSVGHVHGRGLWWFLELVRDHQTRTPLAAAQASHNIVRAGPAETLRQAMLRRGLLCHASGSLVRIQPPLIINEAQLREGLAIVDEALALADAAVG
jgi:taurine--2-oxoglutarate transaminase